MLLERAPTEASLNSLKRPSKAPDLEEEQLVDGVIGCLQTIAKRTERNGNKL